MHVYRITSSDYGHLNTEITFNIASSRALGAKLLQIKASTDSFDAITESRISRILRALKKKGFISLFASSKDYENTTAEIEYLVNKHPELQQSFISDTDTYFIVKL